MISTRYAIATCFLLAVAAVPVVIHEYLHIQHDDGRRAGAISLSLGGYSSMATGRKAEWVKEIFATDDWIERDYDVPGHDEIRLFVVRSFDIKRVYHHPELAVLYGIEFRRNHEIVSTGRLAAPTRILRTSANKGVAAYVLLYEDRFVRNPILFQLLNSLEILFSPRKQMTLFLVYDKQLQGNAEFSSSPASQILSGAIDSFVSQLPEGK